MNIGSHIVARVLEDQELKSFLDAGLGLDWLSSTEDRSHLMIFGGADEDAYRFILTHYDEHQKIPGLELFRRSFPQDSYGLVTEPGSASELADLAREYIRQARGADKAIRNLLPGPRNEESPGGGNPEAFSHEVFGTPRRRFAATTHDTGNTSIDQQSLDSGDRKTRLRREDPDSSLEEIAAGNVGCDDPDVLKAHRIVVRDWSRSFSNPKDQAHAYVIGNCMDVETWCFQIGNKALQGRYSEAAKFDQFQKDFRHWKNAGSGKYAPPDTDTISARHKRFRVKGIMRSFVPRRLGPNAEYRGSRASAIHWTDFTKIIVDDAVEPYDYATKYRNALFSVKHSAKLSALVSALVSVRTLVLTLENTLGTTSGATTPRGSAPVVGQAPSGQTRHCTACNQDLDLERDELHHCPALAKKSSGSLLSPDSRVDDDEGGLAMDKGTWCLWFTRLGKDRYYTGHSVTGLRPDMSDARKVLGMRARMRRGDYKWLDEEQHAAWLETLPGSGTSGPGASMTSPSPRVPRNPGT